MSTLVCWGLWVQLLCEARLTVGCGVELQDGSSPAGTLSSPTTDMHPVWLGIQGNPSPLPPFTAVVVTGWPGCLSVVAVGLML